MGAPTPSLHTHIFIKAKNQPDLESSRIRVISQGLVWLREVYCTVIMKAKRVYRLVLESESRLEELKSWRLTPSRIWVLAVGGFLLILVIAALLVGLTPLRSLLPGYLKETERAATIDNLLRADSLNQAIERNKDFLSNIREVLDTDRVPSDSLNASKGITRLTSDSLIPPSAGEEKFVAMMKERERFNISVIAPLASEGMVFYPVNAESVFAAETRDSESPRVILAEGASVGCIADGTVVAVYPSERDGGGHTVMVQHGKGFLSSYSRLVLPTVSVGESVEEGQIISVQQSGQAFRHSEIIIRMWHNGTPLRPYDYIGEPARRVRDHTGYEAPRGR